MKNGKWIWCEGCCPPNAYVDFITEFTSLGVEPLLLEISADSQYEAYVNGQIAAFGQYPDYPWYKVYDSVDITGYVVKGVNRLCIRAYCDGTPSSISYPGKAALRFSITEAGVPICESGEAVLSRPSVDYASGPVDKVSPQLSFSFACDLSRRDNWLRGNAKGFGASREVPQDLPMYPRPVAMLKEDEAVPGVITAQGMFRLTEESEPSAAARMQRAWLSPLEWREIAAAASAPPCPLESTQGITFSSRHEGLYVIVDLGQEQAGFLEIDIAVPTETRIDIGYGEHLDDLRVRTSVGGRCYAAQLVYREGRNHFVHRLKRIAGRYLQLFVYEKSFTLYRLSIRTVNYPLPSGGAFHCSDSLHNAIYDTAVRTLRLCIHTHYEDCPMREQALYGMDSRNQMLCGYYAFGEYGMAKASLRLLSLGQREDGLLPLCAPAKQEFTIPGFSLFWMIALQEYVLFSGDRSFGHEMLPVVERIFSAFFARKVSGGLLSRFTEQPYWNFYEWQPGLDGEFITREHVLQPRLEAPLNALLALALCRMRELCGLLGVAGDRYTTEYEGIAYSFHTTFWNAERKMYRSFDDGSPHYSVYANSLAFCAGLCPPQERSFLLEKLANPDNDVVPATLSSAIFRYDALMTEAAFQPLVLENIAQTYGSMLFRGATSFWETQRGAWDFDLGASLCHGWAAVPVYIYHTYVLGIRPEAGGFRAKPYQAGIAWAEGKSASPLGGLAAKVSSCGTGPTSLISKSVHWPKEG